MDIKNQFQLLPGTKKRLGIKVPGENRFLYVGSAILGAVLVTSFAINRYVDNLTQQIDDINGQISAINQKRDSKGEEILKVTKQQIEITSKLIKGHSYWTQGLYKIASLIQNEVQLQSFTVAINKIDIKILATNYATIAKQIASFTYDDSIKDVDVQKITPDANGLLGLTISLVFNESKLIKKP